jgi:tRNA(Ile)-lysidine synthase
LPQAIANSIITQDSFEDFMAALGPFEDQPHVAVALSGGADSLCLTLYLNEWLKARGGRLTALTVDHKLRTESTAEAQIVAKIMHDWGIEHHILVWEGAKPKTGIQARARDARYGLLADYCRKHHILHLCLAHHLDDQVETYYLRKARGSTPRGLACMSSIIQRHNHRILRPFLQVSRNQIEASLKAKGIAHWVNDPSNQDQKYSRVAIRQTITKPEVDYAVSEIQRNAYDRIAIEEKAKLHALQNIILSHFGYASFDYKQFMQAEDNVIDLCLLNLLQCIGGLIYPPRLKNFEVFKDKLKTEPKLTFASCLVENINGKVFIFREGRNLPKALNGRICLLWDNRFWIDSNLPAGFVLVSTNLKMWKSIYTKNKDLAKICPKQAFLRLPAMLHLEDCFTIPHLSNRKSCMKIFNGGKYYMNISYHPRHPLTGPVFSIL